MLSGELCEEVPMSNHLLLTRWRRGLRRRVQSLDIQLKRSAELQRRCRRIYQKRKRGNHFSTI